MPMRHVRLLPATGLALALLLGGCGKGADQPTGKAAGAQVLPGTISDAMLDLDQSRARPLLQPAPPAVATAIATDTASAEPSEAPVDIAPTTAVPAN